MVTFSYGMLPKLTRKQFVFSLAVMVHDVADDGMNIPENLSQSRVRFSLTMNEKSLTIRHQFPKDFSFSVTDHFEY